MEPDCREIILIAEIRSYSISAAINPVLQHEECSADERRGTLIGIVLKTTQQVTLPVEDIIGQAPTKVGTPMLKRQEVESAISTNKNFMYERNLHSKVKLQ